MSEPAVGRLHALAGALLFIGLLAIYGISISNHLTEDSLWYARDIFTPTDLFFHPHHLLYDPMMRLLAWPAIRLLSDPDAKLMYLQGLNVLFGAAAAGAFFILTSRLGARLLHAVVFTSMLGLSAFPFVYSSMIEMYSLTSLFLCVSLIGLTEPRRTARGAAMAAGGFAAAMLFHQTAIFFSLVILIHECFARRDRGEGLVPRLMVLILAPLSLVIAIYMVVAFLLGHRDPISFWHWLTLHVQYGYWGQGTLSRTTLQAANQKFSDAIAGRPIETEGFLAAMALYAGARLAARGRVAVRRPEVVAACLTWMTILALFNTWWDASGAEFWGMFLVPFLLVLCLMGRGPSERHGRLGPATDLFLAAALILLVVSDVGLYRNNLRADLNHEAARALARTAGARDRVFAAGTDAETYDDIFLEGRGVKVAAINVKLARLAGERSDRDGFTDEMIDRLAAEARAAGSQGGRCLVDRRIVEAMISTTRLTKNLDLDRFRRTLPRRFAIRPVGGGEPAYLYELAPLPEP